MSHHTNFQPSSAQIPTVCPRRRWHPTSWTMIDSIKTEIMRKSKQEWSRQFDCLQSNQNEIKRRREGKQKRIDAEHWKPRGRNCNNKLMLATNIYLMNCDKYRRIGINLHKFSSRVCRSLHNYWTRLLIEANIEKSQMCCCVKLNPWSLKGFILRGCRWKHRVHSKNCFEWNFNNFLFIKTQFVAQNSLTNSRWTMRSNKTFFITFSILRSANFPFFPWTFVYFFGLASCIKS